MKGSRCEKLDAKTGTFQHPLGSETLGLDIGPSTTAIVGETQATLQQFAAEVVRDHAEIRRLQRHLDRQRRTNNPECYDAQKRPIQGQQPTQKSRRQGQTEARLAELFRRKAAHRKALHGRLAHQILGLDVLIKTEKLSYQGFQKRFGRPPAVFVYPHPQG